MLGIIEEVKCNMLRTRTHVHYYYYIDALQTKSIVFSNLFKLTYFTGKQYFAASQKPLFSANSLKLVSKFIEIAEEIH